MPDDNTAGRAMRSVAIGRKNLLCIGSLAGGRAAAIACTPVETAKFVSVDPEAGFADTPRPHRQHAHLMTRRSVAVELVRHIADRQSRLTMASAGG